MTHREKVDYFIDDMAKRGVSEFTAAPPAWRTAWGLGLQVPPPHFLGFTTMALASGLPFGTLWGIAMWYLVWRFQGWAFATTAGIAVGILFGVCLAAYYRYSAAKHNLPSWREYPHA